MRRKKFDFYMEMVKFRAIPEIVNREECTFLYRFETNSFAKKKTRRSHCFRLFLITIICNLVIGYKNIEPSVARRKNFEFHTELLKIRGMTVS